MIKVFGYYIVFRWYKDEHKIPKFGRVQLLKFIPIPFLKKNLCVIMKH